MCSGGTVLHFTLFFFLLTHTRDITVSDTCTFGPGVCEELLLCTFSFSPVASLNLYHLSDLIQRSENQTMNQIEQVSVVSKSRAWLQMHFWSLL